jgi:hypothetical protein
MTQPTDEKTPDTGAVPLKQVRAAVRTRELSDLLGRRPELAGVYGPADLAAEAVRWCA